MCTSLKAYKTKHDTLRLSLTKEEAELLTEVLHDWQAHQEMHDEVDRSFNNMYVFSGKLLDEIGASARRKEIVEKIRTFKRSMKNTDG